MDALLDFWLIYGAFSIFLTLFFILIFGTNKKFIFSVYRLFQVDLIVNTLCYSNTWTTRLAFRHGTAPWLLYLYRNYFFFFRATVFATNFFFHSQCFNTIVLCLHRYTVLKYPNSNYFWNRWYIVIYLFGAVYCVAIILPVAQIMRPISYDAKLGVFTVARYTKESTIGGQCGGGKKREADEPPDGPSSKKNTDNKFVTAEELADLEKYMKEVHMEIERRNSGRMTIPNIKIKFQNLAESGVTPMETMGKCFDIIIRKGLSMADGNLEDTKMVVALSHPGLKEKTFWMCNRSYQMINGHTLQNTMAKFIQSNEKVVMDTHFAMELHIMKSQNNQNGGCRSKCKTVGKADYVDHRCGAKAFVLGDGRCLLKAVAIAMANHYYQTGDEDHKKYWRSITRYTGVQEDAALMIERSVGLSPKLEHSMDDLRKIAQFFDDFNFIVFERKAFSNTATKIEELNPGKTKYVTLIYYDGHFDFVKKSRTVINARYCKRCGMLHNDLNHYRKCKAVCRSCGHTACLNEPELKPRIKCNDCGRLFENRKCFESHTKTTKGSKTSMCQRYNCCPRCNKVIDVANDVRYPHVCGNIRFCRKCRKYVGKEHENCCYNPSNEKDKEGAKKKQENFLKVVYDVETKTVVEEDDKLIPLSEHEVNVVCWETWCQDCTEGEKCNKCTGQGSITYNDVTGEETVVGKFTKMLLYDEKFNKATVLAHNGGCYDHHFVIGEMIKNHGRFPNLTRKGGRIIVAHLRGAEPKFKGQRCNELTFKDSYNFLPMALAKLPTAFGIEEMVKGTYPYYINQDKFYGKVLDELPDVKYYDTDSMQNVEQFRKYHEENRKTKFSCDDEVLKYCRSDVQLTMAGLKKFVKMCKDELGGWNPILSASTIPSFVMHLMKYEHIREGEIGYIPENGFPKRTQSKLAIKYLFWLEKQTNNKIQQLRNGGEKQIEIDGKTFHVDGFIEDKNEIIEVYGCAVHGCPECFNPKAYNPLEVLKTNYEIYAETIERHKKLENAGYRYTAVWEHEIKSQLHRNSEMRTFFKRCRHTNCLRPRDAMYGGRTQPHRYLAESDATNSIRYLDYCSLYPFVNMTAAYPMGQPEVITSDFADKSEPLEYRGLIYCDVLPPTTLELPILPYRSEGKLLFPLCRTCAENLDWSKDCEHNTVQQRYLTGTWYSEELKLALNMGYKLLRYHEVWHWDDHKWQTGGFFARYLKPLLKMKHEASGWPPGCVTDEQKEAHIKHIEETDGVRLDKEKVEKNPALRSMAKLFLNSAWGKFCENPAQEETEVFDMTNHIDQANFWDAPEYEMTSLKDIGGITMISRMKVGDYLDTKNFANVVFGVITTAVARLQLYIPMQIVGLPRLLYCDTDSIVFEEKVGENLLGDLVGTGLGKLESEVPEGFEITKFVAIAPKCYGYEIANGDKTKVKHIIKSKGVTLDAANSNIVTLGALGRMAREMIDEQHATPVYAKVRGMKKKFLESISCYETTKIVQPVVDKLRLCPDGTTLPHGYTITEITDDYLF